MRVRKVWTKKATSFGLQVIQIALLVLGSGVTHAVESLVPLAKPGPWSGVSGLIGYGERLWFVNSVKFANHNSADIYSYDPANGRTRYERHLFSQDAGEPVVYGGLLFWPFEDARFSAGHGEYMVTNGRAWQWRIAPEGQVFHIHAMATHRGSLIAATSAWRAGLQRSDDGLMWNIIYDHPGPPRTVTRITSLATLGETLYAGLTDYRHNGSKLLRWVGDTLHPVPGWPVGTTVTMLTAYRRWLYGVNTSAKGSALWRTDGKRTERITDLNEYHVIDLAAGPDALWAVTADRNGGILWRSADGMAWHREQRFKDATPLDVYVYSGRVYVGTAGPAQQGTLWGPPTLSPIKTRAAVVPPLMVMSSLAVDRLQEQLAILDRLLADESNFASYRGRLLAALQPLALGKMSKAGTALAARLDRTFPDSKISKASIP